MDEERKTAKTSSTSFFKPFEKLNEKNSIQLVDTARMIPESSMTVGEQVQTCIELVPEESVEVVDVKENITIINRTLDICKKSFSSIGSHNSPFRKKNSEIELYGNMLPKDLSYYQRIQIPTDGKYYTVGMYNSYISGKHDVLLGSFFTDLEIRDFDTLSDKEWLSNFVIDICLALNTIKLNLQYIQLMSCDNVAWLMQDSSEKRIKKIAINENCTLLMPWLVNDNHWIIVVVNFNNNTCFIMDPFDPVSVKNKNRFDLLFKSLKNNCSYGKCGKNFPELRYISCPMADVPKQTDSWNCGVFVIYYAFTIMAGLNFNQHFNPMDYRNYLKKYLLENSEDMTDICLFCGHHSNKHRCKNDESSVGWVSCIRCCRWVRLCYTVHALKIQA